MTGSLKAWAAGATGGFFADDITTIFSWLVLRVPFLADAPEQVQMAIISLATAGILGGVVWLVPNFNRNGSSQTKKEG